MKYYRLYIAKPVIVYYLTTIVILLGVMIFFTIAQAFFSRPEGPPWELFAVATGIMLFVAYFYLRLPFRITIRDDNQIEFRSLLKKLTLPPGQIISVKAKSYMIGFIDIKHSKGTVHLLNQMDGFHDLIATLKSLNPRVEIKGC